MPKRNIGWRWHLASFPEITAWQLEVNKSWSCEKLFPSLLPSLLLSSLQRQTPQHVFHIFASQFIELLSARCLRRRLAPDTRARGGERGWGARGGLGPAGGTPGGTEAAGAPGGPGFAPPCPGQHRHQNRAQPALTPLFAIPPQPVLWQEKLWQQKRNPLRPRYHWQVRTALAHLCCAWRGLRQPGSSSRAQAVPRTICCPLVLSCTGGLTWKPGGSLCGDSVIACELSGEAVSSATALTVRSTLCLESFWLSTEGCVTKCFFC